MTNAYYIPSDAYDQTEMLDGVFRRTMATTDRMMLVEIFLERDSSVPEHSHPHDQIGYVVYGQIEFTIGDKVRVCVPGDSYGIPGEVVHSAKAAQDTLLVEVFTPPREEYRNPEHAGE